METQIQKWGNSLGVRISVQLAKKLHLHPGTPVTLEVEEGKLIMNVSEYNLDDMVDAITPKNRHHLLLDDSQKGNEEW